MQVFFIKDFAENMPAGIIQVISRKAVDDLYQRGYIADPKIKAEIHLRKWRSGTHEAQVSSASKDEEE